MFPSFVQLYVKCFAASSCIDESRVLTWLSARKILMRIYSREINTMMARILHEELSASGCEHEALEISEHTKYQRCFDC